MIPTEKEADRRKRQEVWLAIILLGEPHRTVLTNLWAGHTHQELAKKMGKSRDWVRKIKQEAIEKVRRILGIARGSEN
jgi:DNA-directed RNA polymerase specialized sigma24 family protein